MDTETWIAIKREEGRLLQDAFPELYTVAAAEMNGAAEVLRQRGIIVHEVPPFLDSEEALIGDGAVGTIQYFPRDSLLVIGSSVLGLSLVTPYRRTELAPLRRFLLEEGGIVRPEVQAMPDVTSPGRHRARLEGGDCLLTENELFVGISGNTSNLSGGIVLIFSMVHIRTRRS
jgi:N-dimethylarginine dimethylaminohydrolase